MSPMEEIVRLRHVNERVWLEKFSCGLDGFGAQQEKTFKGKQERFHVVPLEEMNYIDYGVFMTLARKNLKWRITRNHRFTNHAFQINFVP